MKGNVVVTGGTSGLGNALVLLLKEKGYNVITCGRNRFSLKELEDNGIVGIECDIRFPSSVEFFFKKVDTMLGEINTLVLNAGTIAPIPLKPIIETEIQDLRYVFETNLFGNFRFLKEAVKRMHKGGIVIHITSDASFEDYENWGAYSASKAAFDKIIRILNVELKAQGIKAISVDPGDMDTPMHRKAIPDSNLSRTAEDGARKVIEILEAEGNE